MSMLFSQGFWPGSWILTPLMKVVPHIGSTSVATREKMATMAATNLVAGLSGKVPSNLVDKEVLGWIE